MNEAGHLAIGFTARISNPARFLTARRIDPMPIEAAKPGTQKPCSRDMSTSSYASCVRSQNGESSTIAAIDGSRSPKRIEVTAPIECPHSAIVDTSLVDRKYFTTAATSSCSKCPRDTKSPPDIPDPAKSNAKTVIADASRCSSTGATPSRHPAFPCMCTHTGSSFRGALSGWNFHHEHRSVSPRLFVSSRSCRMNRFPHHFNSAGPSSLISYSDRGGRITASTS
mmetsp:Transcript_353/g.941  ORF Transcript_353/g.941 Transcript_353/m.941 type:complete len:225 (+) Transcript_353:234-908(+)